MWQMVLVIRTFDLTVSGVGWNSVPAWPADSQLRSMPHIYIITPDNGLPIRPKHVEV
jgi:hypothetical protein